MKNPTISEWKNITRRWNSKPKPTNPYVEMLMSQPNQRMYYKVPFEEFTAFESFQSVSDDDDDADEVFNADISDKNQIINDKNLLALCSAMGLVDVDLDSNTAFYEGDKNPRKIGKILNSAGFENEVEILKKRNNIAGIKDDCYLVISAHPYDVLQASYRRNWDSCLDPEECDNFEFLFSAVVANNLMSLICYLVRSSDMSIRKPIGRTFIHSYMPIEYQEKAQFVLDIKSYEIFGHTCNVMDDFSWTAKPENKCNVPLFDTSSGWYGKFPDYFKWKLAEIVNKEINAGHPLLNDQFKLKTGYAAVFNSGYADCNDETIRKLKSFPKPSLRPNYNGHVERTPNKTNPTVDDVIEFKIEGTSWARTPERQTCSARSAYRLLKNPINRNLIKEIEKSNFHFYQLKEIIDQRPALLSRKYLTDALSSKGHLEHWLISYKLNAR